MAHHPDACAPARHAPARAPAHASGIRAAVTRYARHLWARRTVARLAELDNHLLKDIGLTRADVAWARSLPLSRDAAAALAERAEANRMRQRQQLRRAAQGPSRGLACVLSAL